MEPFTEYEEHDGIGLAHLVSKGEVQPAELVEAAIARIERWNPLINAVVHKMYDRARAAAASLSKEQLSGPLGGVPMVLKDLHAAVAGEPLTAGCRFLKDNISDHDSTMVQRITAGGLLILGKTNLPELGILGVSEPELYGPARNPWNLDLTPGGSSGGSGAAVAAGIAPIGHGGDGGGSLRIPATCCGVFALKPTRGRMPTGPDYGESWCGFDCDGFITRSVRDTAALLDLCAGPDQGAPYFAPLPQRPYLETLAQPPGKLRIAYTTQSLYGETTDPHCKAAVESVIPLLEELGHSVVEARPPFDRERMVRAYLVVVAANVARDIAHAGVLMGRKPDPAQFEAATWFIGQIGRSISAAQLVQVLEDRHLAWRRMAPFFEEHDLLLTPTIAHPPQRIGEGAPTKGERVLMGLMRAIPLRSLMHKALDEMAGSALEKVANTMLFNMTGQPAVSLPLHWTDDGIPIGVQLAGRLNSEDLLLRVSAQLEQARPWKDRRPPLPEASA